MQSAPTYGGVTKTFHWLTALLILTVVPLGAIANRLPYDTNEQLAFKAQLFSFHKTLGVIVFTVALGRILWALTQTKPAPLHPERRVETLLAELVHWLLYISLVAVPLTGWINHAATTGFAPILLPIGQELPLVPKDEGVAKLFAGLHWVWSKILVGAVLLHIAGAFKHQLVDKDTTLRRMWFGKTKNTASGTHQPSRAAPVAALVIYALATAGGAMAGMYSPKEEVAQASLARVSSDWTVTEGDIALSITQFGNAVTGRFEEWTSAIAFDESATGVLGDVTTTISISSLQLGSVTSQAMGPDFFDAEAFPTATFTAKIRANGDTYLADGTLTIKGNEVPMVLPFAMIIDGDTAQMMGAVRLDRRSFQIGQSMSDESNLGFAVDVGINLTATRAAQ